jgi:hypothetical protein
MPYYSYFQKLETILSSENLLSTNLQNLSDDINIHRHDKLASEIRNYRKGGGGGIIY